MVGERVGGVNVFGGGLALYRNGIRVGGVGVSGDTSCTDHMVAWKVRNALGLDSFNGVLGVADAAHPDNIIFDINPNPDGIGGTGQAPNGTGGVGQSASGFGHPKCLNNPNPATLPPVHGSGRIEVHLEWEAARLLLPGTSLEQRKQSAATSRRSRYC